MRDMEYIYNYLDFHADYRWLEHCFIGGSYTIDGVDMTSSGWQGCVDDSDHHWFIGPYADGLESLITYCVGVHIYD